MNNPYEVLAVSPTATPEEIKKAYRKASKTAHPDRNGGDARRMQEINDAYALLSDPTRRAHYDSTGEERSRKTPLDNARSVLATQFDKLVESDAPDLVMALRNIISQIEGNIRGGRQNAQLRIRTLERRQRAFKGPKGGVDFLTTIIENRLLRANAEILEADEALQAMEVARGILDEYSYESETPTGHEETFTFIFNNAFGGYR